MANISWRKSDGSDPKWIGHASIEKEEFPRLAFKVARKDDGLFDGYAAFILFDGCATFIGRRELSCSHPDLETAKDAAIALGAKILRQFASECEFIAASLAPQAATPNRLIPSPPDPYLSEADFEFAIKNGELPGVQRAKKEPVS